jgi:hypothetical protein
MSAEKELETTLNLKVLNRNDFTFKDTNEITTIGELRKELALKLPDIAPSEHESIELVLRGKKLSDDQILRTLDLQEPIITTINHAAIAKTRKKTIEAKNAFLQGLHPRLGAESKVGFFGQSGIFDRNSLKEVFEFVSDSPPQAGPEMPPEKKPAEPEITRGCTVS